MFGALANGLPVAIRVLNTLHGRGMDTIGEWR